MDKAVKKQLVFGAIFMVCIFAAILAFANGFAFSDQLLARAGNNPAPTQTTNQESTTPTQDEPQQPEPKSFFTLPDTSNVMYIPLALKNEGAQTKITLQNNESTESTIDLTLIGGVGDWHSYSPITIPPNQRHIIQTNHLANVPTDFDPGVAIISSDNHVAAIAEIINTDGKKTRFYKPSLTLDEDHLLPFSHDQHDRIVQDTLVVSNLNNTVADIQLALSTKDDSAETFSTYELEPFETRIINIEDVIGHSVGSSDYASVLASSTSTNILTALCSLDAARGTWGNIVSDGEVE
ncbi:hypothetical protein ACFL2B_01450 [Patescibacteria group bacterium]